MGNLVAIDKCFNGFTLAEIVAEGLTITAAVVFKEPGWNINLRMGGKLT